jgi:hypothetical protein
MGENDVVSAAAELTRVETILSDLRCKRRNAEREVAELQAKIEAHQAVRLQAMQKLAKAARLLI